MDTQPPSCRWRYWWYCYQQCTHLNKQQQQKPSCLFCLLYFESFFFFLPEVWQHERAFKFTSVRCPVVAMARNYIRFMAKNNINGSIIIISEAMYKHSTLVWLLQVRALKKTVITESIFGFCFLPCRSRIVSVHSEERHDDIREGG